MKQEPYYETKKCRCLVEYGPHLSEDLYLLYCGIEYCAPNKSWGPEKRSGYHLHFILSGEGILEVEGRRILLHNGQMFLEKPGELTYYYPNTQKPWTYCWVAFDGVKALEYMEQSGFGYGINTLNCYVDPQEFYRVINAMLDKPTLHLSSSLRRFGLLNEFISLAVESNRHSGGSSKKFVRSNVNYVDYARDYMRNNSSTVTVADVANYLGISRNYLTDLFRVTVGISPRAYLNNVRLLKSAQLLADTRLPIQDIAELTGYENPLSFSRAFKNAFGVSPSQYRENPGGSDQKISQIMHP